MDFSISVAQASDSQEMADFLVPIVQQYVTFEFSQSAEQTMLNSMSADKLNENIAQGYQYYLARSQNTGQLLGLLGIKNKTHLFHLFVAGDCQKSGIGRRLWEHYLSISKAREITVNSSRLAVDFYKKLGFVSSGELFEKNGITCYPMKLSRN